jgi:hypothetical protein
MPLWNEGMLLQQIQKRARQASPLQMAVLVVLLAGCGAPSLASTLTAQKSQSTQAQKAQAAMSAMNACLQKAGYKFAGPPSGETSDSMQVAGGSAADQQTRDDPDYKKAYDKCATSTGFKQFVNSASRRQPSAQDIRKANQQILKLYACMRQKGWTLSDPTKNAQGMLTPPMPPSTVQGDQARMSQFGNDLTSCAKKSGGNLTIRSGSGGNAGSVSVGG